MLKNKVSTTTRKLLKKSARVNELELTLFINSKGVEERNNAIKVEVSNFRSKIVRLERELNYHDSDEFNKDIIAKFKTSPAYEKEVSNASAPLEAPFL